MMKKYQYIITICLIIINISTNAQNIGFQFDTKSLIYPKINYIGYGINFNKELNSRQLIGVSFNNSFSLIDKSITVIKNNNREIGELVQFEQNKMYNYSFYYLFPVVNFRDVFHIYWGPKLIYTRFYYNLHIKQEVSLFNNTFISNDIYKYDTKSILGWCDLIVNFKLSKNDKISYYFKLGGEPIAYEKDTHGMNKLLLVYSIGFTYKLNKNPFDIFPLEFDL